MVGFVINRAGKKDRFYPGKVRQAIFKAAKAIYYDDDKANEATEKLFPLVLKGLSSRFDGDIPHISDIEEMIIQTAGDVGHGPVATVYENYRDQRARVREVFSIVSKSDGEQSSTDALLLIESESNESAAGWDRSRIVSQLEDEANLSRDLATSIAKGVENIVFDLHQRGVKRLNTTDIRALVDISLRAEGLEPERRMQELLAIPTRNLESLIFSKSQENANIATNNPEAVNLGIAEIVSKNYALNAVFGDDVKMAHSDGRIHLHELGYLWRVYCSAHSLEFIKKYGLGWTLSNLESKSSPTNYASVLSHHVQTFLASKQADYAGALGFGFLNIFYSSLLNRPVDIVMGRINGREIPMEERDLEKLVEQGAFSLDPGSENYFEVVSRKREMREVSQREFDQVAQNLIYSSSQNAFSRGGQTLFIDFNLHTGVPNYLKNVPAIGPRGKYVVVLEDGTAKSVDEVPRFDNPGNPEDLRNGDADNSQLEGDLAGGKIVTYGQLEDTAQRFAKSLLKSWRKGDKDRRPFHFPKCDLHITEESFDGSGQEEIVDMASEVASENGSVYFMFDRGDDAVLAQCCRLRTKIEDPVMLKYPERLRFVGFQNVTINLPQAAYRARSGGGGLEETISEIGDSMELALEAHLQKRKYIQGLLDTDGSPLRGAGKPSDDGVPYIELDKATYIIGCIGLNEAVQVLTGKQLHEGEDAYRMGLEIVAGMYGKIQEFKKREGLNFTIEETPAESTTRRLAKVDWKKYGELARRVIKGTEENPYYSNSIHFVPDADISGTDRNVGQSKFHDMIESGAITHEYIGEYSPDPAVIKHKVKQTLEKTRCSQLVFSPTYTECDSCGNTMNGENHLCTNQNCRNHTEETLDKNTMFFVTRIVGYYSRVSHWNASQQQIYSDRKKVIEFYAGKKQGRSMAWLYSPNGRDGLTVMQFGKNGCPSCENVEEGIRKRLESEGLADKVNFEVYHLDEYHRDGLVKAAEYGVPLDVVPSVVVANRESYWKKTTKYSKREGVRSDLIRAGEVIGEVRKRISD